MRHLNLQTAIPAAALAFALATLALPANASSLVASQGTLIAPIADDFSGLPATITGAQSAGGVTVTYVGTDSGINTVGGIYDPLFANGYTDFTFTGGPIVAFGISAAQSSLNANLPFDLNGEVLNGSTVLTTFSLGGVTQTLQDYQIVNSANPVIPFTEVRLSVNVGAHVPGSSALPDASIFDNAKIAFDTSLNLSTAPEPASWAMMIVGFFGLGGALRRRRHLDLASA